MNSRWGGRVLRAYIAELVGVRKQEDVVVKQRSFSATGEMLSVQ